MTAGRDAADRPDSHSTEEAGGRLLADKRILSPVPKGSGALILHNVLSQYFSDYQVRPYSPLNELFPPGLARFSRTRFDLLHASADHAVFMRRREKPWVVTLHGYNIDRAFSPYATRLQRIHYATDLRWSLRRSLQNASAVVAVSEATAELVRQDLGIRREIHVILNGVETRRFHPPSVNRGGRADVRVLFCGNLSQRKGAHWLQGVADRLAPNVTLVCAAGLRARGMPSFDHPRIEWLGRVEPQAMPNLYREMDAVLALSVREGLSLAVLEAMASGLPVVASNVSSFPEQIHEGKGGYLCSLGDIEEFASRINELAGNQGLRRQMGVYNRELCLARFDVERMAQEYADLFEGIE